MSEQTLSRPITVDMVREALNLVTYHHGTTVEDPEPPCEFTRLCHPTFCRFPRYHRNGAAVGLTAYVLLELGYPLSLLKELDHEYEMGELLHPGVKIGRSRNAALNRLDSKGRALLEFLQDGQKLGWSWNEVAVQAFRPRWTIARLDARRRPWLY